MTIARPHVRGHLPWLRSGPLFRVHRSALDDLTAFLGRHPYKRLHLDGRQMTTRSTAHGELSLAFAFPNYAGGANWDAFNDDLGDFVQEHNGQLFAVVWDHIEVAAQHAPVTTAEVAWALLEASFGQMPTLTEDVDWAVAFDVFVIGDGDDFDRP